MSREYIVYKYTFPDGKVYIGRTHSEAKRLGKWEEYKSQYVYRKMLEYDGQIQIEIVLRTTNIFKAFFYEYELISENYENSYNAAVEDRWFDKALDYLGRYVHPTKVTYVQDKLNEFVDEIREVYYNE